MVSCLSRAIGIWLLMVAVARADVPASSIELGPASAHYADGVLHVSTGLVERVWQVGTHGLVTQSLRRLPQQHQWVNTPPAVDGAADWIYPGIDGPAQLEALDIARSDDAGFTSEHIHVAATFYYPESEARIRYVVWVYPQAPGLRTQISASAPAATGGESVPPGPALKVTSQDAVASPAVNSTQPPSDEPAWYTSAIEAERRLEIEVSGLMSRKPYHLGCSWIGASKAEPSQSIAAESIDREQHVQLIAPVAPAVAADARQRWTERTAALPPRVNVDGSVRIVVEPQGSRRAKLSELWLYGRRTGAGWTGAIDPQRRRQLEAAAPEGMQLVAYIDLGKDIDTSSDQLPSEGTVDHLPFAVTGHRLLHVGYFAGTQQRNRQDTPLLREVRVASAPAVGDVDWSSVLSISDRDEGLLVVKESHKCVNTPGLGANTGRFTWDEQGVANTGTGWFRADLSADRFRSSWATWLVLYQGSDDALQLTLKQFDRQRFPIDVERDMYVLANTWGSGHSWQQSIFAAREDNVLREIDSQADLGIDVQQIDAGWDGVQAGANDWQPVASLPTDPRDPSDDAYGEQYPVYPQGWSQVVARAEQRQLELGLWVSHSCPLPALQRNYDQGGFRYYKIDFGNFPRMAQVEDMTDKARALIEHSQHQVRVNWDVTEVPPRFGYFFAREYGNIYVENRKSQSPREVVYVPYLVLRDAWHLSRYVNLNKFQLPTQNVDLVNREASDAHLFPHDYALAQTLMAAPVFFMETQRLTAAARGQIKPLLARYREVRQDIFARYVCPVGSEPSNKSWTGFQALDPRSDTGYVLLFRERQNQEPRYRLALNAVAGQRLEVADLLTDRVFEVQADAQGYIDWRIDRAPGYLFAQYRIIR